MDKLDDILIRQTTVEVIRPLRHQILRAGLGPEAAIFDGDDEPASRHVGAFTGAGEVVGCVSIVQRPLDGEVAWQLRGMAIAQTMRGRGWGRLLLLEVEQIVRTTTHSNLLWCNARTPVVGFYSTMGWTRFGDQFHIETAGPHYRMRRRFIATG